MLQRPKILLRTGRISQPLRIPIIDLIVDANSTILSADMASASATLTVKNITGLAVNQILLIGEAGNFGSEIIKTHGSTAPTGSTVTLASNTVFPHSSSTTVRVLNFDQVEISTSPTATGTKTVLITATIVADNDETNYNDLVTASGFYFARFKNSITATFSPYSDPAPFNGYTISSARSIIDSALGMLNKKTSEILTDEFCFQEIDNCQMECLREFKRWSFMQAFDVIIGNATTGTAKIALPIDCDDQNTTKSIYNFRIGKNDPMIWIDKEEWDYVTDCTAYSTLASAINLTDVTITLTDSGDFDDAGTVLIGANQISYTANDRTTNVLTIVASTVTGTIGQDAFQGASMGSPFYFTVWGGYLHHWPVTSDVYNNRNYYLDYYKSLVPIQHDSDNVVLPDPTVVQYFLAWKMLLKLHGGGSDNGTSSSGTKDMYTNYLARREKMKQKESLNRNFILNPAVDTGYPY